MRGCYAIAVFCLGSAIATTDIPFPSPTSFAPYISNPTEASSVASRAQSDLSVWRESVSAQPAYTSFLSALSQVVGQDDFDAMFVVGQDPLSDSGSVSATTPSWWSKLPSSAQAYATSIGAEEASILAKDLTVPPSSKGVAETMKAVGAAAVGVVAGAAMLL